MMKVLCRRSPSTVAPLQTCAEFAGLTCTHRCDKRLQRLQKILCKRVYYFVHVYLNKNHMSETKQNYDGKPSNRAFLTARPLFRGLNNESSSATVIISGQENST